VQSALRAVKHRGALGVKLPQPFPALAALDIHFRRGQMSLIAAATGGGKSAFGLNYAIKSRVKTLDFTADTDLVTTGMRTAASHSGKYMTTIEACLDTPEVRGILAEVEHLFFCPDPSPTVEDITEEVRAYVEVHGEFPELIIVDNLINVQGTGDNKWDKVRGAVDSLRDLARETEAHVLVLCHTTGQYSNPADPIPLSGLEFKPGNNVEMVLTLYRPSQYTMRVCPVKNRHGGADPEARLSAALYCDLSRMDIATMPDKSWNIR
jgi:replicative DNA helicase